MRIVACLASLALGLSVLTSCSSDSDRLGDSDLEDALLTVEHLGDGFVVDDEDDDDDESLGCLDALDSEDQLGASGNDEGEVEIAFELDDDFGFPAVFHTIKSFDDEDEAQEALDEMADSVDGCDRVDETNSEGTAIELDIETDDTAAAGADDQLNINATGEISEGEFSLPFNFSFRFALLENNLIGVGFANVSEIDDEGAVLLDAALALMEAVIEDEDPPPAEPLLAEYAAGSDSDFAEDEPETGVTQPLDGGSHTWPDGVTMTLTIDRVEPYGQRDDFCGDGSCGIAEKDDLRLVLKYEVTVPDDAEPFDPYNCPGQLHVASGNDDEAFGGVAGDYDSDIDGTMLPGTTKHGFAEYYVKKEYADEEFYLESTCGGGFDGETVFFRGVIATTAL